MDCCWWSAFISSDGPWRRPIKGISVLNMVMHDVKQNNVVKMACVLVVMVIGIACA